jgi:hypothetical protein
VSIYIAWKVFRWQSGKDHQEWIRENKKQEWKELISLAAEVEIHMPSVGVGKELIDAVKGASLDQHLRVMTLTALKCVFVASAMDRRGIYDQLVQLRLAKEQAHTDIIAYEQSPTLAYQQGRPRPLEVATEFRSKFAAVWNHVYAMASRDLSLQ